MMEIYTLGMYVLDTTETHQERGMGVCPRSRSLHQQVSPGMGLQPEGCSQPPWMAGAHLQETLCLP